MLTACSFTINLVAQCHKLNRKINEGFILIELLPYLHCLLYYNFFFDEVFCNPKINTKLKLFWNIR